MDVDLTLLTFKPMLKSSENPNLISCSSVWHLKSLGVVQERGLNWQADFSLLDMMVDCLGFVKC